MAPSRAKTDVSPQALNNFKARIERIRLDFVKMHLRKGMLQNGSAVFRKKKLRSIHMRLTESKKFPEGLEQLKIRSTQHVLLHTRRHCDDKLVHGFSGIVPLAFMNDVTEDRSSKINSVHFLLILSAKCSKAYWR